MTRFPPSIGVVFCILLLLQEYFVHVEMAKKISHEQANLKINYHRRGNSKESGKLTHAKGNTMRANLDEYEDLSLMDDRLKLQPQEQYQQTSSKRGWINSVFKVFKFGGKVASVTTSVAGLGNAIFRAIAGCCTDFPNACKYRDEFLKLKTEIAMKSEHADEIELEAQNIQVYTNYSINAFEDIIDQLNEIENQQEEFLRSISPEVSIALNTETSKIKKLIKDKNEKGQTVEFMEISSMYESAIDSALSIGIPIVSLVIPGGKKIYDFAVKKKAASSAANVELETSVKLEDPKASSPNFKQGKLRRWLSRGVHQYRTQVKNIKVKLNERFGRAVGIASGIAKGFKVAFNFVTSGLNIYMIIDSYKTCQRKQDEAKKARDELLEADKYFDEVEVKLTEAKTVMERSFKYLRGNITSDSMLGVIENVKEMVEAISAPSEDLVNVAIDLQRFLTDIKAEKSLEGTYKLEENLVSVLRKIPFTIKCYTNKVKLVKHVTDSCKEGLGSFDNIYEKAKVLFDFGDEEDSSSPENCARKTGFRYLKKEDILMGLKEMAKTQNFKESCLLNDQTKIDAACGHVRNGFETKNIAEKMELTQADIELLTQNCPTVVELNPKEKEQVCNLKALFDAKKVAELLGYEQGLVESVKC